jgi:hypothetical protein
MCEIRVVADYIRLDLEVKVQLQCNLCAQKGKYTIPKNQRGNIQSLKLNI